MGKMDPYLTLRIGRFTKGRRVKKLKGDVGDETNEFGKASKLPDDKVVNLVGKATDYGLVIFEVWDAASKSKRDDFIGSAEFSVDRYVEAVEHGGGPRAVDGWIPETIDFTDGEGEEGEEGEQVGSMRCELRWQAEDNSLQVRCSGFTNLKDISRVEIRDVNSFSDFGMLFKTLFWLIIYLIVGTVYYSIFFSNCIPEMLPEVKVSSQSEQVDTFASVPMATTATCADWMVQFGGDAGTFATGDAWTGTVTARYELRTSDGTAVCSTFNGTCTKTHITKADTASKFDCGADGCTAREEALGVATSCTALWAALSGLEDGPGAEQGGAAAADAVRNMQAMLTLTDSDADPATDTLNATVTFARAAPAASGETICKDATGDACTGASAGFETFCQAKTDKAACDFESSCTFIPGEPARCENTRGAASPNGTACGAPPSGAQECAAAADPRPASATSDAEPNALASMEGRAKDGYTAGQGELESITRTTATEQCGGEDILDSLVFQFTSFTTIGYGSHPRAFTDWDVQLFTVIYILTGMLIMGLLAGSLGQNFTFIMNKLKDAVSSGADAAMAGAEAVTPGMGGGHEDEDEEVDAADAYSTRPYRDLMASLLLMFTVTLVGTLSFMLLENAEDDKPSCASLSEEERGVTVCDLWASDSPMDFMTAFYFTFCTVTTVGYGDIYPDSYYSKLFCIVYAPAGVVFFANALNSISAIPMEANTLKLEQYVLAQFGDTLSAYDFNDLKRSVGLTSSDKMNKNDFTMSMLKRLGQVDEAAVERIERVFFNLDQSMGGGDLDPAAIRTLIEDANVKRELKKQVGDYAEGDDPGPMELGPLLDADGNKHDALDDYLRKEAASLGLVVVEEGAESFKFPSLPGVDFSHLSVRKPEGWHHPTVGLSAINKFKMLAVGAGHLLPFAGAKDPPPVGASPPPSPRAGGARSSPQSVGLAHPTRGSGPPQSQAAKASTFEVEDGDMLPAERTMARLRAQGARAPGARAGSKGASVFDVARSNGGAAKSREDET